MRLKKYIGFVFLFIVMTTTPIWSLAQRSKLAGKIFQSLQEPSIYKCYSKQFVFTLWIYKERKKQMVDIDTLNFGFYDSCALTNFDNLKDSGIYYFEVDTSDFLDNDTKRINISNGCAQFDLFTENKETMINLLYNSRQQYVTYRRINALPSAVQKYLRMKGIKLDFIRESEDN